MRGIFKLCLVIMAAMALWVALPHEAAAVNGPHNGFNGCIGCHTPHAAISGTILLWSRAYSTKSFSWSDAKATSLGTTLPTDIKDWAGTTRNCLTCHDGTVTNIPFGTQISTGDLKGSHPVAVPYPYGGVANTYNKITSAGSTAGTAVSGKWNVAPNPAKVRLYLDSSASAPNNHGIECGSCHDPHDDTTNTPYLRDTMTNSALCANCHLN